MPDIATTQPPATASSDTSRHDRVWTLSERVLDLARGLIVADNPFLASSIGLLRTQPASQQDPLATDGRTLFVDAEKVLAAFSQTRQAPVNDLVHVLLHCVLLHPFVGGQVDAEAWSLAADIAVEHLAIEIAGPRPEERGRRIEEVLRRLVDDLGPQLTAERLYRALRDDAYEGARRQWAPLFHVDDHGLWPPSRDNHAQGRGDGKGDGAGTPPDGAAQQQGDADDGTPAQRADASRMRPSDRRDDSSDGGKEPHQGQPDDGAPSGGRSDDASPSKRGSETGQATRQQLEAAEKAWQRAAQSMRVDLQTISRTRGAGLGKLVRELEVGAHERIDYREFLRQFAVEREHMRVSDDEFDYIFYTYGLQLYGNVPLVEPLEYRSERRIRDFAIVIDTSSSVSAKVVQEFVNTTYDVLSSEGGFFAQTNIHIIQADARVQSDTRICSLADLDRWRRNIQLRGFGGTDFRPAFAYVQRLRQAGEFDDLQGLVYFTDGWGIYPERMPPYQCAFVFYDEDHRPELVPPWALQVVLHPGEFESLSVY